MQRKFTVPQFIDIEDKILGPITVRQFIILMVMGLLIFIGYSLLTFTFFIIWTLFWLGAAITLAFVKINGMPFHYLLLNFVETVRRPGGRFWNKKLTDAEIRKLALTKPEEKTAVTVKASKRVRKSSLAELTLIADTGGVFQGERVFEALSGSEDKNNLKSDKSIK
jgi:hypothetical protein